MSGRWIRIALVAMLVSVPACSSDTDTGAAYDPAAAESCADLADMFVGSTQRMLDALGTRSDADMAEIDPDIPAELQTASDEIGEWFSGPAGERVVELCPGGVDEFETLVCEQASSLQPDGEAGERHMSENFPPCDQ